MITGLGTKEAMAILLDLRVWLHAIFSAGYIKTKVKATDVPDVEELGRTIKL